MVLRTAIDLFRILCHCFSFLQHSVVLHYIKTKPVSRSTVVDKLIGDQNLNFMLVNLAIIAPFVIGQVTEISEAGIIALVLFVRVNMLMYVANFMCIAVARYCYIFHWAWISEVSDDRQLAAGRVFSSAASVIGSLVEFGIDTGEAYRAQYQV